MEKTEQVVSEEAAAPITPGVVVEEKPADQEGETPTIPKPRFDEVLNRAKAAEQATRDLQAHVRALETKAAAPAAQPTPTLEQVLIAYDKGQLTETQKDQWVHYLAKEGAKQEFGVAVTQAVGMTKAQNIVAAYVKAMPSLSDTVSEDWQSLSSTYQELLGMGHPEGLVTQAAALRMAFGPLKGSQTTGGQDYSRSRADTFLEGSGGGGHMASGKDPLKDVSERQIAYWKKQGLTKAQMVGEAQLQSVRNLSDFRRVAKKK